MAELGAANSPRLTAYVGALLSYGARVLSCAKAREVYEALPARDRRAIQAFATTRGRASSSVLQERLRGTGGRGKQRATWNATTFPALLARGVKSGWLLSYQAAKLTEYRCHDAVAHWAARDAVDSGAWSARATANHRWNYSSTPELRNIFYTRGAEAFAEQLAERERQDPELSLVAIFGRRCPSDLLASLPAPVARRLFAEISLAAFYSLATMDPETRDFARTLTGEHQQLLSLAAFDALLSGDGAAAKELASLGDEFLRLTVRATAALVAGKLSLARKQAAEILERQRKRAPRRDALLRGSLAPLLTALLITDRSGAWHAWAWTQLRAAKSRNDLGPRDAYDELQRLLEVCEAGDWSESSERPSATEERSWVAWLLHGLRLSWAGEGAADLLVDHWRRYRATASEGGMPWVADQFAAIESREVSGSSLLGMRVRAPLWKRKLRALTSALEQAEASPRASANQRPRSRLVWFVALREGGVELEPRVQKATKSGWSKGTGISLGKLAPLCRDNTVASDADRRLSSHLRTVKDALGRRDLTVFDRTVALGLIDHPLLFDAADPRIRFDAVCAEPELRVTRADGQISISLHPSGLSTSEPLVKRQGHQLLVYDGTDAQRSLVEIFDDEPVDVPDEAESEVRALLASMTPVLTVSSELAADHEGVTSLPAETRPHVQMWRASAGGIRLRIRVYPLGRGGPAFGPGHGGEHVSGSRDGQTMHVRRDLEAERELERGILEQCPTLNLAEPEAGEYWIAEPTDCLELLTELWQQREELTIEWPEGDPLKVVATRDTHDLHIRISDDGRWLNVDGELEVEEGRVLDMRALLDALSKAKGRFLELDDGSYVALSDELRAQLEDLHRMENTAVSSGTDGRGATVHPLATSGLGRWLEDAGERSLDSAFDKRLARVREATALRPAVPKRLDAELRDYQQEGFQWLARLAHFGAGACLADDMGLGKTVQVLALLLRRVADGPAIVLAPTSVVPNWEREASRFAPTLAIKLFAATGRSELVESLGEGDVLLCSYGQLQRESEMLAKTRFATLILDEAQAIKNASTQRAKAARALQADFRVATTGTPVENHLGELWSLFAVLNPGLLGTAKAFEHRFARPIQQENDVDAARSLKRLVRPFMLRRTKAAVLDELPEKTEILLRIKPGEDERAFYEALRRDAIDQLQTKSGASGQQMLMLAVLTKLRRAACNPQLVAPDADVPSAKLERATSLIDELLQGNHRALIFSQFVDHLTILRKELDRREISYQYLDGSTPMRARDRAVQAFQGGEGDVFLISLKAGGFGLNLTAADYVIHLDPWWNPAAEDQASDRVHRIGQQRPVTIYRLVTGGSIEERIVDMHHRKRHLADSLLEGNERAFKLEPDALLAILSEASAG